MNSFIYFSFLQGVFAFFAPCAVALLPAYIISFISRDNIPEQSKIHLLIRGLKLAFFSILGILLIYAIASGFIVIAAELIKSYMKYVAITLGVVLIIIALLMLFGKEFSINIHMKQKEYTNEIKEAFFFGIAYAIGALGCLFPLFLVVATQALSEPDTVLGLSYIVAYFIGISLLMIITIMTSIFAQDFINKKIRAILPYMQRISAIFLIIAGVYVIYYQSSLF
ncbi:cytochrome c biogenesis CcdA family protein [Poseidonibacter antarcticus]|uniref:cytochrome c biogenesis CcdA family protein n=1 Tax=Poseidonibacter antarcticus TaxID=2478538 RepID=UPI000EF4E7C3|nr:cytochrome c biogenesis protein CcdA [Poseidonibacter antarcticus]